MTGSEVESLESESESSKVLIAASDVKPVDVMMGRGGHNQSNKGNVWFLKRRLKYQPQYSSVSKTDKKKYSLALVRDVQEKIGGRFVQKIAKGKNKGMYYEISDKLARKKASQALRETHLLDEHTMKPGTKKFSSLSTHRQLKDKVRRITDEQSDAGDEQLDPDLGLLGEVARDFFAYQGITAASYFLLGKELGSALITFMLQRHHQTWNLATATNHIEGLKNELRQRYKTREEGLAGLHPTFEIFNTEIRLFFTSQSIFCPEDLFARHPTGLGQLWLNWSRDKLSRTETLLSARACVCEWRESVKRQLTRDEFEDVLLEIIPAPGTAAGKPAARRVTKTFTLSSASVKSRTKSISKAEDTLKQHEKNAAALRRVAPPAKKSVPKLTTPSCPPTEPSWPPTEQSIPRPSTIPRLSIPNASVPAYTERSIPRSSSVPKPSTIPMPCIPKPSPPTYSLVTGSSTAPMGQGTISFSTVSAAPIAPVTLGGDSAMLECADSANAHVDGAPQLTMTEKSSAPPPVEQSSPAVPVEHSIPTTQGVPQLTLAGDAAVPAESPIATASSEENDGRRRLSKSARRKMVKRTCPWGDNDVLAPANVTQEVADVVTDHRGEVESAPAVLDPVVTTDVPFARRVSKRIRKK